jgi:transcriptional regulator with XRE-family HTH domain
MTEISQEISRLRLEGWSIRDIAKQLGVTKYTVEKALKDDCPDSYQTDAPKSQTIHQTADQTHQTSFQTADNPCLVAEQTAQTLGDAMNQTPFEESDTEDDLQNNEEDAPEPEYFMGVYGFMLNFRLLMNDIKTLLRTKRELWVHELYELRIKQVEELQVRAKHHCWEHDVEYEMIYVSKVLDACESYLLKVANSPIIYISTLGWKKLKCHEDDKLMDLLNQVDRQNFFALGPIEGGKYNRQYFF